MLRIFKILSGPARLAPKYFIFFQNVRDFENLEESKEPLKHLKGLLNFQKAFWKFKRPFKV